MSIKTILAKVGKGEELTEAEKTELGKFDPDAAAAEARTAAEQVAKLTADLAAANKAKAAAEKVVEDQKKAGMSDLEKAQADLAAAVAARAELETAKATAEKEIATMKRNAKVSELATKHGFEDVKYLDYLLGANNVDIEKDTATTAFFDKAKKDTPKFFKVAAASGPTPPAPGPKQPDGRSDGSYRSKTEELMASVAAAPEVQ